MSGRETRPGVDDRDQSPWSVAIGALQGAVTTGRHAIAAEPTFTVLKVDDGIAAGAGSKNRCGAVRQTIATTNAALQEDVFGCGPRRSQRQIASAEVTAQELHSTDHAGTAPGSRAYPLPFASKPRARRITKRCSTMPSAAAAGLDTYQAGLSRAPAPGRVADTAPEGAGLPQDRRAIIRLPSVASSSAKTTFNFARGRLCARRAPTGAASVLVATIAATAGQ